MATRLRSRRRSARVPAAALALALLLGCGGGDGGGAKKQVETLDSWRATIDLTAEAQLRGWVTPRYAHQLRDKARKALDNAARTAAGPKIPAAARDSITLATRALERAVASLEDVGP